MKNPKIQIIDLFFRPIDNWFKYNLRISSFFLIVCILIIEFVLLSGKKSKETRIIVVKILSILMIIICIIMGIIDTVKIRNNSSFLENSNTQNFQELNQLEEIVSDNGEEWYYEPKFDTGYKIIKSNIFQINEQYEYYAINLLSEKSFIILDDKLSEILIGRKIDEKENLILVRGVAYKTIISDFIIMSDNQNLIILHKDSIKTEELYKFPIVISVNIIPKEVYSFCVTTN